MKAERSGSLKVNEVDANALGLLAGSLERPIRRRGNVRIENRERIACPSPWRHPIAWLRWNPLQHRVTTAEFPDCIVTVNPDRGVVLEPQNPAPADEEPWWQ